MGGVGWAKLKKNITQGKILKKSCTATNRKKILHWKKVLGEDFNSPQPKKNPAQPIEKRIMGPDKLLPLYYSIYHTIENTANQNTGKPLYIPRYYSHPSHHALFLSMAWYKIVMQCFLMVYHGICSKYVTHTGTYPYSQLLVS